jgi:hypothetical protein
LVGHTEGALSLLQVDDLSPLTEIAPTRPLVLEILSFMWLQSMATDTARDTSALLSSIDKTLGSLVSSFKGTDAVTLLAFLADLLRKLDPEVRHAVQRPRYEAHGASR